MRPRRREGKAAACAAQALESRLLFSAQLVQDINPGIADAFHTSSTYSSAGPVALANGTLLLAADDGVHGTEPWRSDGTAMGTHMLADLSTGPASSDPQDLLAVGNSGYFFADIVGPMGGYFLWETGGTPGDVRSIDSFAGVDPNYPPGGLIDVNGTLFFWVPSSTNPDTGELWKTSGTAGGTFPIAPADRPLAEIDYNGSLAFLTSSGLWQSDGTASGTTQLVSIAPTGAGLVLFDGKLVFAGSGALSGTQVQQGLWETDGTVAGTSYLGLSGASAMAVAGNSLFVLNSDSAGDQHELFKTDGTVAGTVALGQFGAFAGGLGAVGSSVLFWASDPTTGQTELWRSDGTVAGTIALKAMSPGAVIQPFVSLAGQIYFADGTALWQTDGTAAGTRQVDVAPAALDPNGAALVADNGSLYFHATTAQYGDELWRLEIVAPSQPPVVTDVRVRAGSQSLSLLGLGRTLPWANISGIDIAFNENVAVSQGDLVLSGVKIPSYSFGGFTYDPATFTAHWTLAAPPAADRIALTLDGTSNNAVRDAAGDLLSGGNFSQALNVLPGDATGDGAVSFSDLVVLARNYGRPGNYLIGDFNADGTIGFADLVILARNYGRSLPPATTAAALLPMLENQNPDDLLYRRRRSRSR